ncbi:MAG: VanW family protein [Lachnospiraceae bacterium]|nr:VanW family protein [Lachnospiraceae bacterium]
MRKLSIAVVLSALAMVVAPTAAYADEMKVHEGVYAEGLSLAGKTESEAAAAIESYVEDMGEAQITLNCSEDNTVTVSAADLGIKWNNTEVAGEAVRVGQGGNLIRRFKDLADLKKQNKVFDVEVSVDEETVKRILSENCAIYDKKAVNATISPNNAGSFTIIEGSDGEETNIEASYEMIRDYFKDSFDGSDATLALEVDAVKPKGDAESLSMIKDVLGTYSTTYKTSSSDRAKNVSTGCSHINGSVLYPGEQLSVYETVSPFTEENGYAMAGSYLNGLVVESLGGGICQVSTTLYQAVLRAELQVDQRSNHSMVVNYVPHAGDAAIAGTAKDFKFTNNTDYPIYIAGKTQDREITFTIYGVETRPSNRTIDFESVDISTTEPVGDKIIADASQPAGFVNTQSAHTGYVSEYWKIVKENGTEVSRELVNKSTYKATQRTITLGTATSNAVTASAIQSAIASGDGNYAKAVAAAVKLDGGAGVVAQQQQAALAAQQAAAAQAAAAAAAQQAAAAPVGIPYDDSSQQ